MLHKLKLILQNNELFLGVYDKEKYKIIKMNAVHTVLKFQDFSVTYILREINFWDSRELKICQFLHFKGSEIQFLVYFNPE